MTRTFLTLVRSCLLLGLATFLSATVQAQTASTTERTRAELSALDEQLSALQAEIDEASAVLDQSPDERRLNREIARLDEMWTKLKDIETSAESIREQASESIDAVTPLLEGSETAEQPSSSESSSPAVATPRSPTERELETVLTPIKETRARASMLVAEARLAQIEARRLSLKLTTRRDRSLLVTTLDKGPSPLRAEVWTTVVPRVSQALSDIAHSVTNWRQAQIDSGNPSPFPILALTIAVAVIAVLFTNRRFYRWQLVQHEKKAPTRQQVAIAATTSFVLRLLLAIAATAFVMGVMQATGILETIDPSVTVTLASLTIALVCARALVESVMAPRTTDFRLIAVGDEGARAACFAFFSLVLVFAAEGFFEVTGTIISPGPELLSAGTFFLSVLTAGLLCWLALKLKPQSEHSSSWLRQTGRLLLVALGLIILGASLAGYSALSRYMVERIVLISFVLLIGILLRELLRATALQVFSGVVEKRRFESARDQDPDSNEGSSAIQGEFWIRLMVDALMIMLLPPFILLAIGMPAQELWIEGRRLMAGVEIGGQQISLGKVFSAFLTLAAVLLATRIVQQTLEKNILPHTQISSGASNSLITLLGYAGVLIAGIAAISVIGFDLSSLAIIAGALSVGIGFGLQSIVSNFVAGLILLFERPFKIGDWIVTPSGEGTVRKINVRATEVETFDRQSIIVPNAELVSSAFGNWTHKSEVMRITVAVGVKYGTEPRLVEKLLLEAAETVDQIRAYPPAYVLFKDFGDSALKFELRGYILANDIVIAPSELRYVITEILKREGVTIPFPQRDLHIDVEELKGTMEAEASQDAGPETS